MFFMPGCIYENRNLKNVEKEHLETKKNPVEKSYETRDIEKEYKQEREKIFEKYLKQQFERAGTNLEKYDYKGAKKAYLTLFFMGANDDILEKLRKIPLLRTHKPICAENCIFYISKRGDTLESISVKFYGSSLKHGLLAEINNLRFPYALREGEFVLIPKYDAIMDNYQLHLQKGEECLFFEDFDCASDELSVCISISPHILELKKLFKESYYKKILTSFKKGKYKKSKTSINYLKKAAVEYKIPLDDIMDEINKIEKNMMKSKVYSGHRKKNDPVYILIDQGRELQSRGMLSNAQEKYLDALKLTDFEEIEEYILELIKDIDTINLKKRAVKIRDMAIEAYYAGEYEEALEKITKAISLDPESMESIKWRDKIYNRR